MREDAELDLIRALRELQAVRITFHPDGQLATVDFALVIEDDEQSPEQPAHVPKAFRELMKGGPQ